MPIDIEALKTRVQELSAQVDKLLAIPRVEQLKISREYQTWYSQAYMIVKTYLLDRQTELAQLYSSKEIYLGYYGICSYLNDGQNREIFEVQLEQQRGILLAVLSVLEIRALEVTALVTADLVQGELNEARLLLNHGFVRASGAVAGVALEAHLKLLHKQSNLVYTDGDTIVPLATRLRTNGLITLGDEKKCIAMADTRNKCDHKKKDEPTQEEAEELISDIDRFTKRVQVV